MNERIKELITEAWGIPAFKISDIFHWDREEKFAELIVRECCNQLREIDAMAIRKHFGVEP